MSVPKHLRLLLWCCVGAGLVGCANTPTVAQSGTKRATNPSNGGNAVSEELPDAPADGPGSSTPPASPQSKDFNNYIMKALQISSKRDKQKGYSLNAGSHTQSLYYNGEEIFKLKDGKSHCVGITFQLMVEALNLYYKETKDSRVWNSKAAGWKWAPVKHCWYVDPKEGCKGANNALEKYGLGKTIKDWKTMEPGDFVNLNRTKSGHSVVFLHYIDGKGKKSTNPSEYAGFRYYSSQPVTNGVGELNAYFHDKCNSSDPERDCGMKYDPWLFIGRVAHPSTFQLQSNFAFYLYSFLQAPPPEPVGADPYFAWESEG